MKINVSDIYIGERRRKDYGTTELRDLQASLEENGQITPITVRPPNKDDRAAEDYDDEPWVLVAGGRRLMAAGFLGWKEIEAYGREEMDSIMHRTLELHENLKRKNMSWEEEVQATKEIAELRRLQHPEITNEAIAKELGISPASLSKDLQTAAILEKNPSLKGAGSKHAALNAGKLLQEHDERAKRILSQPSADAAVELPLEQRVVTSDAVSYASALPARSVDLMLLDGPYGYNYWKSGQKTDSRTGSGEALSAYDDDPELTGELYKALVPHLLAATRETGWLVFFCGKETYDFLEELLQDYCAVHGEARHHVHFRQCEGGVARGGECRFLTPEPFPWIWYRPNSNNKPRFPQLHARNMMELILVCNMGKGRLLKQPCPNVLMYDTDYTDARVHANEKPMPLYRDLVSTFTFAGDTVCDTFFGSGNSLAAAASLGRIPRGCDKNPTMLQFALGKIRQYQQDITREAIERSLQRYQQGLAREEVDEATAPQPMPKMPGEFVTDDAQRVRSSNGDYFCSFVQFRDAAGELWNTGQKHGATEEEAYAAAEEACRVLNNLLFLSLIDPEVDSRDKMWATLTAREASDEG